MRHFRATIVAEGEQYVLHILSVCVCVALGIKHAMRMSRIVNNGLPGSHKRHDFRKLLLNITCVLILSTIPTETFLILRRI